MTNNKVAFTIAGTVHSNITTITFTINRGGVQYSQTNLPLSFTNNIANFTHTENLDARLVN
jgi:hypothetical protein